MITPSFNTTATERVLPKLALDFTTGSLDSRITFTRALNTATRVNSSGLIEVVNANIPRFDYDSTTLQCKGLLIEESRTNLLTYSDQFDNLAWEAVGITITNNTTVSPDGSTTADTATVSNGSSHYLRKIVAVTANTAYSFSFYAKRGTATDMKYSVYNLSAFSDIVAPTSYYTQTNTSGFVRVTVSFTTPVGCTSIILYTMRDSGSTGTVYFWGAQLEAGAFPTSYIPTTTTALTRNADVATMTGTNFSSWYNQAEGTFYIKANTAYTTQSPTRQSLSVRSSTDFGAMTLKICRPTGLTGLTINDSSNTTIVDLTGQSVTSNTNVSLVGGYKNNNFAFSDRGVSILTDTSGTMSTTFDKLIIGSDLTYFQNGHINKIMYWPLKLINSEIQAFSK